MRRLLKEQQNPFNSSSVVHRKNEVLQESKSKQVFFGQRIKSRTTTLAVNFDEPAAYKNSSLNGNQNQTSQFHEITSVDSYCSTFRTRSREGMRNESDKRQLNKEAAAKIMKTMPKTVQDILTKIIQQTNKNEGEEQEQLRVTKRNDLTHNASQDSNIHCESTKIRSLTLQSTNQRHNTSTERNLKTISRERNGNSLHSESSKEGNHKTPYLQILQNMMHVPKTTHSKKQPKSQKGQLKSSTEASSVENHFLNNCSISSCSEREDTYFQDFSFEVSAKKKKKDQSSPFGLLNDLNTQQIEVRQRQNNQENINNNPIYKVNHPQPLQLKQTGLQQNQKNLLVSSVGQFHLCADKENINSDGIHRAYQSERCNTDCSSLRQSKQLQQSRTILSQRRNQLDKEQIAIDMRNSDKLGISKRELLGDCKQQIPNSRDLKSSETQILPKMALLRDTKKGVIEKQVGSQSNQSALCNNPVTQNDLFSKLRSLSSLSVEQGEYSTTPYDCQSQDRKQTNYVQSSKERTLQMLINQLKPTINGSNNGETKGGFFEGMNQQKQNNNEEQEITPLIKPNNQKQEVIKDIIKGMSSNAQQVLHQIMNRGQLTEQQGNMNLRQNNSKIYCKTENDFSFEDSGEVPFRFFNEEKESQQLASSSSNQVNQQSKYGFTEYNKEIDSEDLDYQKYQQLKEKSKSFEGGYMIKEDLEVPWNGQDDRGSEESRQESRSYSVSSNDNGRDSNKQSLIRKSEIQSSSYAEQRRNRQNYIKGSYSTKSRPQSSLAQLAQRISSKNLNINQYQTMSQNSMQRNFKSTDLGEEIYTNRLTKEELQKLESLACQKLNEIQRKNGGKEKKLTLKQSSSLPFQKGILGNYLENKITLNCSSNNTPILAVKPQIMIHPPVPKSFLQSEIITTAFVQKDSIKQQKMNYLLQGNDPGKQNNNNKITENNEKMSSEVDSHLDFSYNSTDIGSNIGSSYLARKHGQQPYLFSSQKNSLSFEADRQLRNKRLNDTLRSTHRQQQQQSQEQISRSSEEKEEDLKNKQLLLPCRSQSQQSSNESRKEEEERARKVEDLQLTVSEKEAEIMQLRLQVQDLQVVLDQQKFQPSSRCDNLEEKILCSRFNLVSLEQSEQKFSQLNPKDKIKAVKLQLDIPDIIINHSEYSSENGGGQSDSSRIKCNASEIDLSDQIRSLAIAKNLQLSCSSTSRS